MTQQEFSGFLKRLYVYHGKPSSLDENAAKAQADAWYEQVRDLPVEPLDWMYVRLTRDWPREGMPRNVAREMLILWNLWLKDHPEKRVRSGQPGAGCPHCLGGWLFLVRYDLAAYPKGYEAVAGCGHCRSVVVHDHAVLTVRQAWERGWELRDCMPQRLREREGARGKDALWGQLLNDPQRAADAAAR